MSVPDLTTHIALDDKKGFGIGYAYGRLLLGTYTIPQTDVTTRVAVKYLIADSYEEQETVAKRIEREAAIWIMLDHPNIVPFFGKYALRPPPAPPALVYLYCSGESVILYLASHPDADRCKLALETAKGMQYIHQREVLHGDFSPTNVLIRENGEAAIAHFGRAKILGYRGLSTTTRGGSRYTAPEAWDLKGTTGFTKEADVYSFGATALHILSGKPPYYDMLDDEAARTETRGNKFLRQEDYPGVLEAWWNALEECWDYSIAARPTMTEILDLLLALKPE